MKVTFIGHAAVEIKTEKHSLLIDPFITGNPVAKHKPEDFQPDAILLLTATRIILATPSPSASAPAPRSSPSLN
jgi:L-ascorbate metabolism protein UlaG (beta-lactamase superfamily)